ncbi:MAG: hypothetical protein D6784_04980 [Chloroflexi bacterium]|nr:MAG: hypothetical protein D6784_04980 [Chloroflexota bacterium]
MRPHHRLRNLWPNARRDLRVFAYLFPWRTAVWLGLMLVSVTYLFWLAFLVWEGQAIPFHRAFFAIINLIFLQVNFTELPLDPRLDIFALLAPVVGLPLFSIFGLRIFYVLRVLVLRRERGQDWHEALVAATIDRHILVCGLGRIGYRVANTLAFEYGQTVVGINDVPSPLTSRLIDRGLPVILGNVVSAGVLEKAGVSRASTVVICTNVDQVNLETLVRVRQHNPQARIVLRLFDDDLAAEMKSYFQVDAVISRSAVAGLSFAYAALGARLLDTFRLKDRLYVLVELPLAAASPLTGRTIGELMAGRDLTVVCHTRGPRLTVEPPSDVRLLLDDTLLVFASVEDIVEVLDPQKPADPAAETGARGPVLVCGVGRTGYRVSRYLLRMGYRVVALDTEPSRLTPRLRQMGIPVKFGDLRWGDLLIEAGAETAPALIACTDDDLLNLQIALRARRINPHLRVVLRIFDDALSEQLRQSFGPYAAFSTSALASTDFISAALNRLNVHPINVAGTPQLVVRLTIRPDSQLAGTAVDDLHQQEGLTALLHARDGQVDIPPQPGAVLQAGDELVVLATESMLADLNRRNESRPTASA